MDVTLDGAGAPAVSGGSGAAIVPPPRDVGRHDPREVRRSAHAAHNRPMPARPTGIATGASTDRTDRAMNEPDALVCHFGEFELDEANARLTRGARAVALPPKALAVLGTLARHPGRLVTKNALLDEVWGHRHVSESVLKSTISQVRAALGDSVKQPRYIETVSRHGYRFIAPLQARVPAAASAAKSVEAATWPPSLLVGREAPLAQLAASWMLASQGQRQLVWVTGEAGIGKTRLVDAFEAQCDARIRARGQCVEPYGTGEPYLPMLDALAAMCRADDTLPALLRRFAPTWLLQLPWLLSPGEHAVLQQELSGAGQDRMLREMGELLDHYTATHPLLLVIEDLHWSDSATVRLIDHLARRRTPCRMLLVGTFRSTEVIAADHPLKPVRNELRAHRLCSEITLDPLSERDVGDYLALRLPAGAVDERLVAALHAHTDGLPLFVANVLDDLLQREGAGMAARPVEAAIAALQGTVPESLAGVIEKQLDRVEPALRPLLAAASVRGMVFGQQAVADALGCDPAEVSAPLARLAQSGAWIAHHALERHGDGSLQAHYTFRHSLYRQVLYQHTAAPQRAEWHHRIARSLETSARAGAPVSPAEMAMHNERGEDPASAARWYAEAAAHALGSFAPVEASQHAERGIACLLRAGGATDAGPVELSLLVSQGVAAAQRHGMASAETVAILERARHVHDRLPPGHDRACLLNGLGWVYFSRGEYAKARAQADDMIALAEASDDSVLRLCGTNLRGAAECYSGGLDEARRWLEQSLESATTLGPDLPRGRTIVDLDTSVRVYLALTLMQQGRTGAARAQAEAALARAHSLGHPMSLALAYRCQCQIGARLGDVAYVESASRPLSGLVARHGIAQSLGPSLWYRGWVLAHEGAAEEGLRLILEGQATQTGHGMPMGCALVLGYAAQVLAMTQDAATATRRLHEARALALSLGETFDVPALALLEAELMQAQGDSTRAAACAVAAVEAARAIHATRYEVAARLFLCGMPSASASQFEALRVLLPTLPPDFDPALRERARANAPD